MTSVGLRFVGAEEAQKRASANRSPRFIELDELEAYVEGRQYEGRPDWFSNADVPLWERAPCIVYSIVQNAIQSNTDLVLGEGRFPNVSTNPGENDESLDGLGLNGEESEALDRLLSEVQRVTRFRTVCRGALAAAQKS